MNRFIAVVGGGAAGMTAALAASEATSNVHVFLLEQNARVGQKLLVTGNGRCNLLNLNADPLAYHGTAAPFAALHLQQCPPKALLEYWEGLGVFCRADGEGRVYPASRFAGSVLDALRQNIARRVNITLYTQARVHNITVSGSGGFQVEAQPGPLQVDRLILATGGAAGVPAENGFALLRQLGHPLIPARPALAPLRAEPGALPGLKGVRTEAAVTLCAEDVPLRTERGEVLFSEDGVSGIAAMQCAHPAGEALAQGKRVTLRIDLLPEAPAATWRAWMAERAGQGIRTDTLFTGLLHPRIAHWLLQLAHITPGDPVTGPALDTLAALVRDLPLRITGVEGFDRAQVTAGGADASAFDPATLQSRIHPGLFIAGELLDVDGDCGGYNLMWAWLSGRAAGRAAALGT